MQAIQVHQFGDPEVLRLQESELPEPGPGEARVRIELSGVNFIDIYHRTGAYPGELPFVPGMEAAGVVEAVGEGVGDLPVGERVAYAMQLGSYAEFAVVPSWKLVPLPDGVETRQAAALMLQGMTAHYLTHSTFRLDPSHTALVHAGAGGVGRLLIQLAKRRGARVIATVSTTDKARIAETCGADHVILYTRQDFKEEVARLTASRGVDVVYDSVGKDTFERSLQCLRPRGMLALYGQSSGAVGPFDAQLLNRYGSLFLTRPSLVHYAQDRREILQRCKDLFGWLLAGQLDVHIDTTFPLARAADAHRHLQSRASTGKLLLET